MGNGDINTFLDQAPKGNAGGKMKDAGTAHWNNPNEALLTAVVSQVFQEGIVTSMVHSTALATTVTGGVLRRTYFDAWYRDLVY
jgi:hypothetical protein